MMKDVPQYHMPLQVLAVHCLRYMIEEPSEVQHVGSAVVWPCTLE